MRNKSKLRIFGANRPICNLKINRFRKCKNYSEHDEMTFIKDIEHKICLPRTILINKSLSLGIVLNELKTAKVYHIYEATDKDQLNNYRSISLLPTISEIPEKIIPK